MFLFLLFIFSWFSAHLTSHLCCTLTHFEKLNQYSRKNWYFVFFALKRRSMCTILLRRRILDQSLPFKSDATLWYSARTLPVKKAYFFFLWELQRKLSSNHILNREAGILSPSFFFVSYKQGKRSSHKPPKHGIKLGNSYTLA